MFAISLAGHRPLGFTPSMQPSGVLPEGRLRSARTINVTAHDFQQV